MLPFLVVFNVAVLVAFVLLLREMRQLRRTAPDAAAARRRAEELERLVSALPDPLVVLDRNGQVLDQYPGSNRELARGILQQLGPDDRRALEERFAAAMDRQERRFCRLSLEGRIIVADIWPLSQEEGGLPAAAVCLRDVTDLEESASRLDRLAARNRAILRSAMDGFFVVDQDYRFLEVNDAFCRMTGYSAAELLNMRITDLEVAEPPGEAYRSPLRTGLHQFATAHRHRDGRIIRLETSVIVLRDGDRKILVGFARDVTERLRAEETLERLSRQNKLILDSAAEGIFGVDTEGRITFANPAAARLLSWEVNDLIGNCAHELVVNGRQTTSRCIGDTCALCAATQGGRVQHGGQMVFRRKDGTTFPVEYVSSPMHEGENFSGAVFVFRDISERQRAEEERRQFEAWMQQAQKLESLGMLAGGLAHDFNNLLLSVLCHASLALERLPAESAVRSHVEKIAKSARRASELTRQMLTYAGHAACDAQPLGLNALIEEIADLMRAAFPKTVRLELELAPGLPMIEADPAQLQQVVMNLLINAAEAIGHCAGTITVRTSLRMIDAASAAGRFVGYPLSPGQYVCLEVQDTGCGMTPEVLARIFDPFFTTKATGRGLGLSALLGIVRSHRGAVHVTSSPGGGTRFDLLFPAATRVLAPPPAREPARRLPAGATVLVVDDEEEVREVVQAVLESRGVRVLTAGDGPSGIQEFRRHADEVDAVLLDMTMPGMTGDAVLQEILSIRPDARVILSSGYSEQQMLTQLRDQRICGFVHKPYTAQALLDSIAVALAAASGGQCVAPGSGGG